MRTVNRVLAVVLLGWLAACGTRSNAAPAAAPDQARTMIEVRNNNWLDVVVYAQRSTLRVRLGMVTSMNSGRFALPHGYVSSGTQVQLVAEPVGSPRSFVSPVVHVGPGQLVQLTLQNHLPISSIAVR